MPNWTELKGTLEVRSSLSKVPDPKDYPNLYFIDLSAGENVVHHYYDCEEPNE